MTEETTDRPAITLDLVRRLVGAQFPQWGGLRVAEVGLQGWDNRTFRLGDELLVRLPSAEGYTFAVAKEQRWLPVLAPHLPLPIPAPVAQGVPGAGYPFPWSVYRWIDGQPSTPEGIEDLSAFAATLAEFLNRLRTVDATGGPGPGPHNFFRGGPVRYYAAEVDEALVRLRDAIDVGRATEVWETALATEWDGAPVWFHGDIAQNNLLLRDGELAAVLDFGTSGVGDPACDLVIAWTMFTGESRAVFRDRVAADRATWERARGWGLWKALITYDDPGSRVVLGRILDDR